MKGDKRRNGNWFTPSMAIRMSKRWLALFGLNICHPDVELVDLHVDPNTFPTITSGNGWIHIMPPTAPASHGLIQ